MAMKNINKFKQVHIPQMKKTSTDEHSGRARRCDVISIKIAQDTRTNRDSSANRQKRKPPRSSKNSNSKCPCVKKVSSLPSPQLICVINPQNVGLEKLYNAAAMYIRAMGKKKEGEDREKSLPPEILGQAMISHGGEYAPESAYGQGLLKLGSGMERLSRLQEVAPPRSSPPLRPGKRVEKWGLRGHVADGRRTCTRRRNRRWIPWNGDSCR
jgi:hypothetical protein